MRSSLGINAHWTTLYCSSLFFHSINSQGCYKDGIRINPWTQNGSFKPIPNTEHWNYTAYFNQRKAVHDTEVNHLYICTLSWREYSINIPNRTIEGVAHTHILTYARVFHIAWIHDNEIISVLLKQRTTQLCLIANCLIHFICQHPWCHINQTYMLKKYSLLCGF